MTELPSPGPSEPVPSWDEYDQLLEAVEDYLDCEPYDHTFNNIWKALAVILGNLQRDAFIDAFDLDEPAETPCIRRLITGEEECDCHETRSWEDRKLETIGARDDPPHAPPHHDHATLWLDADGKPALYGMHVYPRDIEMPTPSMTTDPEQERRNGWFDLFEWAGEWGLEVGILPKSWYNLGSTVHVVFYPPERYR